MSKILKINRILTVVFLVITAFNTSAAGNAGEIESRLQVLEDKEAIRDLLMDYGRTLDARDFKSFSELFARDVGEWNGGMGVARGPQAIRKLMEETITGKPGVNFHIFNNESIDVDGDRATAVTKWTFVVQGDDGRPQWVYLGHYNDILIREDGRWKFLQRKVTGDIPGESK